MKVDQGGQPYSERQIDKLKPARQAAWPKNDSSPPSIDPSISRQTEPLRRIAAAKNLVLDAFEAVKAWLESEHERDDSKGLDEGRQLIADLYDKTRLQSEHVLEPYRPRLSRIVLERDLAGLAELMTGLRAEIEQVLPDRNKRNVVDQNRLAVQSALKADPIEGLMQSVVRDLKGAEGPPFNLTRERVIDLLG